MGVIVDMSREMQIRIGVNSQKMSPSEKKSGKTNQTNHLSPFLFFWYGQQCGQLLYSTQSDCKVYGRFNHTPVTDNGLIIMR